MSAMKRKRTKKKMVSPGEYRDFIKGIDLKSISFNKASFELLVSEMPKEIKPVVNVKNRAELLEPSPKGFSSKHKYNLLCSDPVEKKEKYLRISAEFLVEYSSEKQITDDLFQIFKEVNLPVNTWPYFREYVHSCMGRLNLPPLILPALKRP